MTTNPDKPTTRLDLSHLRREARTALEIAIVELAPAEDIERIELATGLLEAAAELPRDSAPAIALGPSASDRPRGALNRWREWSQTRKKLA